MSAGTGHSCAAEAKGIPSPAPPSLSEDDFAKVRTAVRERDGGSKHSPASPFVLGTASPGDIPVVLGSPSTVQQKQQQSRWGPASGGGSPAVRSSDGASGSGSGGIDQRLFAPVLRAILAGEGDHVLRRSLLCHPFLKTTKGGSTSATTAGAGRSSWGGAPLGSKGSGSGAASSPLSGGGGGRRKDGKGSKGGKAKKRDRDRDRASRNQEDLGGAGSPSSSKSGGGGGGRGGGGGGLERSSPLDVSKEMARLADCAAAEGSLQSTLILVKTLLCAVDPGTKAAVLGASGSPRKQSQQPGGRAGGRAAATPAAASRGGGPDSARMGSIVEGSSESSTGLTLSAAPLKALVEPRLSGWDDMMELLRREKYRERMVALRGRPSLTVCSGKAEMRGRLEAKGEFAGVVTAVQVREYEAHCCAGARGGLR